MVSNIVYLISGELPVLISTTYYFGKKVIKYSSMGNFNKYYGKPHILYTLIWDGSVFCNIYHRQRQVQIFHLAQYYTILQVV